MTDAESFNKASRTIIISEEINSETFQRFSLQLSELEQDSLDPVVLEINSEGGSVYDALAICGRMDASKCSIHTHGYGSVMSAATLILANGDLRKISRHAWFMVHEASDKIKGSITGLTHHIKQARREETQWAVIMSDLTDVPKETWLELSANVTYMTAEECLQLGVVDAII